MHQSDRTEMWKIKSETWSHENEAETKIYEQCIFLCTTLTLNFSHFSEGKWPVLEHCSGQH